MISRTLNFQIYYGWKKWRQKMIATFFMDSFLDCASESLCKRYCFSLQLDNFVSF